MTVDRPRVRSAAPMPCPAARPAGRREGGIVRLARRLLGIAMAGLLLASTAAPVVQAQPAPPPAGEESPAIGAEPGNAAPAIEAEPSQEPAAPAPAAQAPAAQAPAGEQPAAEEPAAEEPAAEEPAPDGTPPALDAGEAGEDVSVIDPTTLPRDFTVLGMFNNADIIVKTVMLGLLLASVLTWTIFVAKGLQVAGARASVRKARESLRAARSLDEAQRYVKARGAAASLISEAATEMNLSAGMPADGIKERVGSRLERVLARSGRSMASSIGIVATIGSVAPFVGLFGTVWGIMNSFIGISQAQTTNLAIVAPGIAEALLATGIGLVAAIPAVVIYNVFTRWISGYRAELGDTAAEVLRIVGRDLDRRGHHFAEAAQ